MRDADKRDTIQVVKLRTEYSVLGHSLPEKLQDRTKVTILALESCLLHACRIEKL